MSSKYKYLTDPKNIHETIKKSLITLKCRGLIEFGFIWRELMDNKETIILIAVFAVALITGVAMCNI